MFPLGNPLLPFAGIPLHVFEDRYRRLMEAVMGGDRTFGVVLIERGSEVGGGDERASLGTLARVAEAERLEDGRWIVIATGVARLRVVSWLSDEPFPRALAEEIPHRILPGMEDARRVIIQTVRRLAGLLTELGEPAPPIDLQLADDPLAAAYQAVAVSPIGALDAQTILEIDDDAERIEAVLALLRDAEDLASLRLAAG